MPKGDAAEMVSKVLQGLFFVPANFLGQSWWLLTEKESVELAKAVLGVIETLPKKQYAKIEKLLKEYAPWIKLLVVAGAIVYGRVGQTMEAAKAAKLEKENAELRNNQTGNVSSADPIGSAYATQ